QDQRLRITKGAQTPDPDLRPVTSHTGADDGDAGSLPLKRLSRRTGRKGLQRLHVDDGHRTGDRTPGLFAIPGNHHLVELIDVTLHLDVDDRSAFDRDLLRGIPYERKH